MAKKEDIGKLFENKLSEGKKVPNTGLWERINSSLDNQKRRRRRIFLYCLVGVSLSILLGWFILFGNEIYPGPILPVQKEFSAEKKKDNPEYNGQNDKRNPIKKAEEKHIKIPNVEKISSKNSNRKIKKKISEAPITLPSEEKEIKEKTNSSTQTNSLDETFSVTKKYYYYNSDSGKRLVTTNKNEIDSLVSLNPAKVDSLSQKTLDNLDQ